MMKKPNRLTIDLPALVHNLEQVRGKVGKRTKIMGIVKSDAYGHGLLPVSLVLEKNGVDCLGVAHLCEALSLRENGIKIPIVILCGIKTREEARQAVEKHLTPVLYDIAAAELISEESLRLGKETGVQIKVDTGMGRLGIHWNETLPFVRKTIELKGLVPEGITSHLSSADEVDGKFTEIQTDRFSKAVDTVASAGIRLELNSLENSAGVLVHNKMPVNMVRPGIILYGGLPSPDSECSLALKPVMHFKGRVLQIRELPDNTPVSYGRTYYTKGERKIAVISAGYGDGLPRSMSNKGSVIIGGKRAPIIGRICMNLTVCDITDISATGHLEEAVFLGTQEGETITGDDIGKWAGTISYEIFCSIGQRHNKEYLS
jgi:alanine racemase